MNKQILYVWKRYCQVKNSACMHDAATCLVNYYVCLLYVWKLHCVVKRNVFFYAWTRYLLGDTYSCVMHEHATVVWRAALFVCMNTLLFLRNVVCAWSRYSGVTSNVSIYENATCGSTVARVCMNAHFVLWEVTRLCNETLLWGEQVMRVCMTLHFWVKM